METMAHIDRRVRAAEELEVVARTMKGVAAVGLRRFEEGLETLDDYERVVEAGVQIALWGRRGRAAIVRSERRAVGPRVGLVAFGSDLGLCGPVNRNVATAVRRRVDTDRAALVATIGGRLADELDVLGVGPIDPVIDLPSTLEGVATGVDDVVLWIDERVGRDVDRIELVVPELLDRRRPTAPSSVHSASAVDDSTRSIALVPIDPERLRSIAARPWPTNQLPTHRASWPQLVSALTRELVLLGIHRAFVQTMAVVAGSRSVAMDAARRDLEERLDTLHVRHRRLRQSEITEQLLDVVAGFEALVVRPG